MSRITIKILLINFLIGISCLVHVACKAQQKNNNTSVFFLTVHYKDSIIKPEPVAIERTFNSLLQLQTFVNSLPKQLSMKGYATASIDSLWKIGDTTHIQLFYGIKYNWLQLRTIGIEKNVLVKSGYVEKDFTNKPLNIAEVDVMKEKLMSIYENEGYPFASIFLDSISIIDDEITAVLRVNKIILYPIDSIKNVGNLKLNKKFIRRYIGISDGSAYNRLKLQDVDRKMLELPFAETIEPSYLDMVGSGAMLRLNVNNKKSSEASAIFGFLPDANNTGKFQLTGDINFDLKNVFGSGEGLLFKYQALQPKSPRLNLGFDKPYIFNSPYGINFLFDLFKKDSSFLQVNAQVGIQLNLTTYQTGKLFVQLQSTGLLQGGFDTSIIKSQKKLPNIIDVSATNVGLFYEYRKTNYRFNPISGTEFTITSVVGIKNIQKNNDIISLKDPGFNYASLYDSVKLKSYQLRVKLLAAHYFKLSKTSTFKAALNAGAYSSPNIFRNEVFQIGGFKLLRGFDEESIYATQYGVATAEFRSLISLNSYLFGFIDAGLTKTKFLNTNANNVFVGSGIGIVYETKAGLLNLSLALGKRNDVPFSLRQASKIHFGYINYF